ncbi:alginate export family protein [Cryomorpha ignava]|uniref:Alginate export family protein n=1 Tax=Cryomorpha ignava TaxID=101383 RepID=A0A7K3WVP9_9FLAO|nr:alginate export family protein [Cryomorpha ignava]NEN25779.1 alginate export family protein [Cryomorpha ignava]
MKKIILFIFILVAGKISAQQFDLSAEIRPRFEFRNGYGNLIPDNADPASFVSQRTRLNFGFQHDQLKLFTSLQNVNVWGDVATLSKTAQYGLVFHEAYGEILATSKLSFKLGRQEFNYDDERIFGAVGWAQQARSHDALLMKYAASENHQVHLGLALNASEETNFEVPYEISQYQNMEFIWYHGKFSALNISVLALNQGMAFQRDSVQETAYNQTFGARLSYAKNKLKADGAIYIQTGELGTTTLSAWYASANIGYGLSNLFNAGAGFEYLSGTDQNSRKNESNSFNPWFGTNHKFNGLMDYFYVGNHINSVGLTDVYAFGEYKNKAFSAALRPHLFMASGVILSPEDKIMDSYLGTEIDFTAGYQINSYAGLKLGYSQMFATESMETLKSGNADNLNNWAWVMVTIKPTLFSASKAKID